jgi:hypothetical protein
MTDTIPYPLFYDSAAGENGEPVWPDRPPGRVMLYADRVPPQTRNMAPAGALIHWITEDGQGQWRALAGDYEEGTTLYDRPGRMRGWVDKRIANLGRAVAYCDRADLHRLACELGPSLFRHPSLHFWIPTLDGTDWTPEELAVNIAVNWQVAIPAKRIWGCQYLDAGDWDVSLLYGTWTG